MTRQITLLWLLSTLLLFAVSPKELLGSWQYQRKFADSDEQHSESEKLTFAPGSFHLILSVTIRKGDDHRIERLRIRADGLWKLRKETLVLVIEQIRFLDVAATHGIDKNSLTQLIRDLRGRYLSDPIRILDLISVHAGRLRLDTQEGTKEYRRF